MPTYDLGLSVATGENYNTFREQVEADNIHEACLKAEELHPGYRVHQGWCIDGGREPKTDADLAEWLATYRHGVLRTQDAGPNGKKE